MTWKQEEFDILLNTCQIADSHERLNGCIDIAADVFGREPKAVFRILWGLAVRITNIDYEPGPVRIAREGKGPNFFDIQMIRWAANNSTKDKRQRSGRSDEAYMAKVLGLPLEVVTKLWQLHGPAKGRKPLFDRYKMPGYLGGGGGAV